LKKVATKKGGDQNFVNGKFVVIENVNNQKWWQPKKVVIKRSQMSWFLVATRCMVTEMGLILVAFILALGSPIWVLT
jgi:hypothetical protein